MALTADVVAGTKILSSWGNEIRNRTIQVFATNAERDSQWPNAAAGSLAYITGSNALYQKQASGQWNNFLIGTNVDCYGLGLLAGGINAAGGHSISFGSNVIITAAVGSVYLNQSGGGHSVASSGIYAQRTTLGNNYNEKNLYIYSGAGTVGQPGLSIHDQDLGAVMLQIYTSSQSTVGFHCVNSNNGGYVSLTASNLAVPSEQRLKTDIRTAEIPDAIAAVKSLRPVHFKSLPPPGQLPPPDYLATSGVELPPPGTPKTVPPDAPATQLGFIAEDMAAADLPPGIIYPPHGDAPATIDLMGMITLLTRAVQELSDRVMALEATP